MTDAAGSVEVQRYGAQSVIDLSSAIVCRQVVQRCVILQRFANRQERVVAAALRNISEAHRHPVARDCFAKPAHRSFLAAHEPRRAEQKSRLPRASRADEPNDLSALELEAYSLERAHRHGTAARTGTKRLAEAVNDE